MGEFMSDYTLAIYKVEPSDYDNDTYTLRRKCECGVTYTATIPAPALFQYRQGAKIQDAFPMLAPADRDFYFLSGMCDSCYNKLVPGR